MISLFSYFLTFIGVIFWVFRVIATLCFQLEMDFFAKPLNVDAEIVVLFLTIPCMLLVIKRNIVGAAAYLGLYVAYFGSALYEAIVSAQETGITIVGSSDIFLLCVGIIIPLLTFLDILVNKHRVGSGGDKNTDWYYKNEAYDRKLDERADKNQYRL